MPRRCTPPQHFCGSFSLSKRTWKLVPTIFHVCIALCVTHPSPPFVLGERRRIFICIDLMRPVTRRFSGAQASSSDFSPYLFKKERLISSLIKIWIWMRVYCFIEGWIGVRSFDRGNWGFDIYSFYRQLAGYIVSISIMEWSCTCRMVNLFDLE